MAAAGDDWPEPVVRVQSICTAPTIPERYVKPPSERPGQSDDSGSSSVKIPVVDLGHHGASGAVAAACREWGFFQVINHGVPPELMRRARDVWRGFFHSSMEEKLKYANSPATYEGYGSRLGVYKGAILDWGDYFFLHFLPISLMSHLKWPSLPTTLRATTDAYSREVLALCERVMRLLSAGLGVGDGRLQESFGGADNVGACLRVNFYPKCPQPELTLGLSSHSDPGGMTALLVDDRVKGLQVRRPDHGWATVDPVPDAFIINVGDQIQIMSNGIYKSVEHRAVVNAEMERLSMAFFYNPRADIPIQPLPELVEADRTSPHRPMTFNEYRLYIRQRGPQGKSQVQSLEKDG